MWVAAKDLGGGPQQSQPLQCAGPPARRATYYRLFIKVEGVDADFRFLTRDYDFDHVFKDLLPGSTVSAYVVAANSAGEAPPSPTVTKTLPA